MVTTGRWAGRTDDVLDALVDLFLAEGFRGASLDSWAARVGCSKSTLYRLAASKDQLVVAVVREFFRRSTARVDARVDAEADPRARVVVYLEAIAEELSPATPAFYADVDTFDPARDIYSRNTAIAARKVQDLVAAVSGRGSPVNAQFVGVVVGEVMESIQTGRIKAATGLDDSRAYRELAAFVLDGATPRGPSDAGPG